ncbi:Uncharacterised protein [Candidatus Ornithobacterium hominis]|nr:Uncharacterised protein [Candidatus Ornithobacterium hominis]
MNLEQNNEKIFFENPASSEFGKGGSKVFLVFI